MTRFRPSLHLALLVSLLLAPLAIVPASADDCRIAFDLGSSGIRGAATSSAKTERRSLDALTPLWEGRGIAAIEAAVIDALREIPKAAGWPERCARAGGGFSAWRLAAQRDPAALADSLDRIQAATGVAIFVMPARQEGAYGYRAAHRKLGNTLATSHILDIGGGSFQAAGERDSLVLPFGQKSWHRALCKFLRDGDAPCRLQPLDPRDLVRARALIAVRLAGEAAPAGMTLTAISRPVTRGVQPAVQRLHGQPATRNRPLSLAEISAAIETLAPLDLPTAMARSGAAESHAAYLLSDLLLVEGIVRLTVDGRLHVAETDVDILPGLLADDRAFAWRDRHACYRDRLRALGIDAYASDPATCPR